MADITVLSIGMVHTIRTEDLKMSQICVKFVPKVLTKEQKENCKNCAQEILDAVRNDPQLLSKVVIGAES